MLLVLQFLLNGNLKRKYLHYVYFGSLKSLAIFGSSMKWKLEGKIRFQMPSWVYAGNWRFLLFAYFCHFNNFFGIMFGSFSKMNKKKFLRRFWYLNSKKTNKQTNKQNRCPQSSSYGRSQCLLQVLLDMDIETRSNQE